MNIPSNIYNFTDYREFLKDRYRQLKEVDAQFSFRFFSKQAGFGSPNYLKLVMDGKRNLSSEAIAKFAKGLRLDNHESEYLKYMVEFNQCSDAAKKMIYEAKLLYLRELFKVKALIPELYDYYHDWYHSAIRETIKKANLANEPAVIAQRLVPAITEAQAKESIELLIALKFIEIDGEGKLVATDSEPDVGMAKISQKIHLEQMATLAAQSIYTQGADAVDFGALTLSLTGEKVEELRAKIHKLIAEAMAGNSQNPSDPVYQLNVQLFAITKASFEVGKSKEVASA